MADAHETKYRDMQKYVPFIQRVIEKLKASNEPNIDNPRKAQLQKMEMLHDLLTNRHKKIKIETLMKCEGVLIKLQNKIEKNEDLILSEVKLKQQMSCKPSISSDNKTKSEEVADILGPASPPPEIISDDIDQPVVIPTERRCSPILVQESVKFSMEKLQQHKKETLNTKNSKSKNFDSLKKSVLQLDTIVDKQNLILNKKSLAHLKPQSDSRLSVNTEYHHNNHNKQPKEHNAVATKSTVRAQKIQTVKVVITKPLQLNSKKQHLSSSNTFSPRSSICHNNLRTLPQATQTKNNVSEAHSPDELWDKYNESHNNGPGFKASSAVPEFNRLGAKASENSSVSCPTTRPAGRYTPIPEVLKSPPLSVSDINNLLLESGADKILNDISEIGSRRPAKNDDIQNSNSFEIVRKKLAQTTRMHSLHSETQKLQADKGTPDVSSFARERVALKYNPHPRQERLQSISSTDGNECATQSKIIDPRIKLKLQTSSSSHSPTHIPSGNVNVLPAINLSDPRLKKQNILTMPSDKNSLPSLCTPDKGFLNQNSQNYGNYKDPRICRITSTQTNQSQCSSEENWDSNEEEQMPKTIKFDKRQGKNEQHPGDIQYESKGQQREVANFERNFSERNSMNQSQLQLKHAVDKISLMGSESEVSVSKLSTEGTNFNKQKALKDTATDSKNKSKTLTSVVIPKPPKSDTEEDWDTEDETSNVKQKAPMVDVAQLPQSKSHFVPIKTTPHAQISPKGYINPLNAPLAPVHVTPIPHPQSKYSTVSANNQNHNIQSSTITNRFNSVLNDKSEREKYFEAKKQKTTEPRTYKEFREAKERAQAKEAAMKRLVEEAEAKKRTEKLKELHKMKEIKEHTCDKREKQVNAAKKMDNKKEKKVCNKDMKQPSTVESTLDKMYRTQNFNSKFPKANTSFKIPKKKADEKTEEEAAKTIATAEEKLADVPHVKLGSEIKSVQSKQSAAKVKSSNEENNDKQDIEQLSNNDKKPQKIQDKQQDYNNEKSTKNISISKPNNENTNELKASISGEIVEENNEKPIEPKEVTGDSVLESNVSKSANDENKLHVRDPRCRSKSIAVTTKDIVEESPSNDKSGVLCDVVITSATDNVVLKPQQNLDKFNQLTQELPVKPQRILHRRNTMVVFDSAPLVDKEKLKKANALLFEDVQEEEKRKRKQAEEDRLIARRNKNLEEMFKRTDDNCTVSTQNIITGKRRTRASINFNETANTINIFKHTTPPAAQGTKATKSNFKIKLKNVNFSDVMKMNGSSVVGDVVDAKEGKTKESKSLTDTKLKCEHNVVGVESDVKTTTNAKLTKNRSTTNKKMCKNSEVACTQNAIKHVEVKTKLQQQNVEYQNSAVSSTSPDNYTGDNAATSTNVSCKNESDDNEPSSTGNKSNSTTSTPEQHVLNEIVDQILKPNANREHILGLLGQILNEEKLELIKSLMESSNRQIEEQHIPEQSVEEPSNEGISVAKIKSSTKTKHDDYKEDEVGEEQKPLKSTKVDCGKKMTMPKKKRTELDRLNEDIRDMFICEGILTATGRRMCTIMGKDVDSGNKKVVTKELTPAVLSEQENTKLKKEEILKPPAITRPLRRSIRCYKTTEDNEDDETQSTTSRSTEDSFDDFNTTDCSTTTDSTMQRKMPVLKSHTPIKIQEEAPSNVPKTKESINKRKSDSKAKASKSKKLKPSKDKGKEDSESEENKSEPEAHEGQREVINNRNNIIIKNNNVHWHHQSKYTTWCMICEKRIPANCSSVHYKAHHRENYISRIAPALLQQYKQGTLNKPLFGVRKAQKQPSWFYRCPFCLKYFNTPMPLWLEHFQNHTVEFRYECSMCHRSSNRKLTVTRHIKSCEGATIVTSAVKLNMPTVINGHVCHLCNFIQLKRVNLERHYIEQHQLEKKTVHLLGYIIKLFDVENVECVTEEMAAEREKEAWKSIEKIEQVIDIDDEENNACTSNAVKSNEDSKQNETEGDTLDSLNQAESLSSKSEKIPKSKGNVDLQQSEDVLNKNNGANKEAKPQEMKKKIIEGTPNVSNKMTYDFIESQSTETQPDINKNLEYENEKETNIEMQMSTMHSKDEKDKPAVTTDLTESLNNEYVVIEEAKTVEDIQDELLALAAEAAGNEIENRISDEKQYGNEDKQQQPPNHSQNTVSYLISSSVDRIYGRDSGSNGEKPSDNRNTPMTASNVFMPTRDENNYSPTIQILAQSIINIEEQSNESVKDKPITMAERLSQRFKVLQNDTSTEKSDTDQSPSNSTNKCFKENAFEKLINDTLLELTKAKDSATSTTPTEKTGSEEPKLNVFDKLFSETVLDFENRKDNDSVGQVTKETENTNISRTEVVTVISDDEDWEDIEITETAPTVSTASGSSVQKSRNKGLFQKFGIFKGNNTKSKKHLPPLVYLPKKKKEKSLQSTTLPSSPITAAVKVNELTTNNTSGNCNTELSFKPVVSIMDGLFPDSPSNDPIDLVPELAPLEPLQDLNDISSILDSNLSAVNINASDNHTSIEDALDFISEQQTNDTDTSSGLALKTTIMPSHAKTIVNNITHVGFSVQSAEENNFKFYCLLKNCSFLYSSDSIGLENHFMCEHSTIKWNGYCLMCQSQCFPNADASEEHSISKEIRHMMEKHANKPTLEFNTDSTQHSTTSSHENDERPKIKLRRLTGDCLSRATPENVSNTEIVPNSTTACGVPPISMLGALLIADPKPPTKDMPPQPQMPLTEPLLLDNRLEVVSSQNVNNNNFLITSVTSSASEANESPLQIASVVSLNKPTPPTADSAQMKIPKISNVRTLVPKTGSLRTQQIEKDRVDLLEANEESLEVSRILRNAAKDTTNTEESRCANDSPVLVAETMPLAQSKTGDFVVTQTVSAQYNEFSQTALGFNISIAASTTSVGKSNTETLPNACASTSIASRQYKCMGTGCKFVSRVPVAMSEHLRFHERRNFSNKRDYLSCGFCFHSASDVEDYMKHANQFHIIGKGSTVPQGTTGTSDTTDTVISLTQKIQNILNGTNGASNRSNCSPHRQQQIQTTPVQDTTETYLKKLRETIDEIVGPTGLADDKLYRCVVKDCVSQLTESTFLSHIMFHISTNGGNPNNYIFKCPHCTAQYHRAAGIKAHIKNHARNRYFCYLCDETSTNPGQLLKHFSEKHWHTLNMYTKELLKAKTSTDGLEAVLDSSYYVAYTQDLSPEEVRKFGEKLILEWQRKKFGSKTHFKSTEIDLLPLSAIFRREVNCGECEYKTKVRTNMFRHLLMHKQNPGMTNQSGVSKVCSVDPVNPVPCLNTSERFFDKMTNLASSSLTTSSSVSSATKSSFKVPYGFVEEAKRYTCGCQNCNYRTISEDLFRTHLSTLHSTAMTYCCTFCQEEICKRGITIDRIMNHTRFHGSTIHRCEECNYVHHLRYVVERHINEKHSIMKVNIITHNRSNEDSAEGTTTTTPYAGKKYKEALETNQGAQSSNTVTRSTNSESSGIKPTGTPGHNTKSKGKWVCDTCGHRTSVVSQMQAHCQQQHGVKNQYKCVHCNFGSQQLSQILHHIDEKHSGKTREARYMYHKAISCSDEVSDTRPLWQRNDPTRIRHIRGILMEDEEESEEYRKKLGLTEDVDEDSNDGKDIGDEEGEVYAATNYIKGYEFGCYHCSFKTQTFEELKEQHYAHAHNSQLETAKPFWFRLHRRLCCPVCLSFLGNYNELLHHLQNTHKKSNFYAADIRMAENDDTSQRILCGYCPFQCANADHLYKHHLRVRHWPQDIRIDNNEQIMKILALGKAEASYQCTLCADIFSNRVAIVQHACNSHAGEDNFSFRELSNSLIYRCNSCCFTSTTEKQLLRHAVDHYSRFKTCHFCLDPQTSFNIYMQHCYADHRNDILKFKTIYPQAEIRKFLLQTIIIIFPNGLVLSKRNLFNTKYGKSDVIQEVYEDIYKISQQPPIPRLSIARLVARKSIEAQQKQVDVLPTAQPEMAFNTTQPKCISKRRCTVAFSIEDDDNTQANSLLKPKFNIVEAKTHATITKRRTTIDHDQQQTQQQINCEFNAPLQPKQISKRRRTVAVDRETLFSYNLVSSNMNSLVTENIGVKKRKISYTPTTTPLCKVGKESCSSNSSNKPFSFYGQMREELDLTKIYTKVTIGGIKTPLTIDKFKLLFDIDCQLKLWKCDNYNQLAYNDYKHIQKACPASHKSRFKD